ncbi:MAG: variant-type mycofactocin precursor [Syntrophobacteraceae bacterium]|nr:variant-type mycofactocin precursor [Syntrophobacteraceae bacterium]MDR3564410.1 variant-type mycofactocin precursor [Negativicutes bacterium]
MRDNKKMESTETQTASSEDDVFAVHEITVEELAIDGICGVY